MKKRVMSGCVIVSGSPFSSCAWKIGTTLPVEPSTLPKRTDTYGRPVRWAASATSISAIRLLAPITLVGRTALSVDTNTNRSTPAASAASSMTMVPPMFTCTASEGCSSIMRHVLVRRGVEDHARRLVGDQPAHGLAARDVGEVDPQLAAALPAQAARLELPLDEVERALGPVDEHEAPGPEREHLARELGPDRAAAARDHDRPAADDLVHAARVLADHRAAEEVLDADAADAVGVHGPVEQVRERGNGADLELQLEGRVHDLPHR